MSGERRNDHAPGRVRREVEHAPDGSPGDDRIERLGRRIGRALSVLIVVALIIYLWHTYLSR